MTLLELFRRLSTDVIPNKLFYIEDLKFDIITYYKETHHKCFLPQYTIRIFDTYFRILLDDYHNNFSFPFEDLEQDDSYLILKYGKILLSNPKLNL